RSARPPTLRWEAQGSSFAVLPPAAEPAPSRQPEPERDPVMAMPRRPARARSAPLAIECLEDRTLPALSVTAILAGGMLMIEGTEGPDNIALWQSHGRIELIGGSIYSGAGEVDSVAAADVHRIVINALGGDDRVSLSQDKWGSEPILQDAVIYGGM